MANNLLNWIKSKTLDKTDLDEKALSFLKQNKEATANLPTWQKRAYTAGNILEKTGDKVAAWQPIRVKDDFSGAISPFKLKERAAQGAIKFLASDWRDTGTALKTIATPQGRQQLKSETKKVLSEKPSWDTLSSLPATVVFGGMNLIPGGGKADDAIKASRKIINKADDVADTVKGAIKIKAGDDALDITKDLAKQAKQSNWYQRLTSTRPERFKQMLPEPVYNFFKKNIDDVKNAKLAEGVRWGDNYLGQLQELKIKPGSKESALIQKLGEKKISYKKLVEQIGEDNAQKIKGASDWFRKSYDEVLDFINTQRKASGLEEVKKRKDYFRHISEFSGEQRSFLDKFINKGETAARSSTIFKKRKGGEDIKDAVTGFTDYIGYAQRAAFTDTVIPRLDEFIRKFEKAGGSEDVANYLKDYKKTLLGMKEVGGPEALLEKVTAPRRKSAVLGNVSTFFAQGLNTVLGAWDANPKNYVAGLLDEDAIKAAKKSNYLIALSESKPIKLVKGTLKKAESAAGGALQWANNTVAEQVWKGYFKQGQSKNVDDIMQYADDMTASIMGDRRLGALSEWMESPIGRVLSAFTIEAEASAKKMIDMLGEKRFGTLLGVFATNYLVNTAYEKKGPGYRPLFDPINATIESYKQLTGSDGKDKNVTKAIGSFLAELSNLAPTLQAPVFGGMKLAEAGINTALPDDRQVSTRDLFGSEDPTWMATQGLYNPFATGKQYTGNKTADAVIEMASKQIPGGGQLSKSLQSFLAQRKGAVESKSGNVMYETPDGLLGKIRQLAFGQNASNEAQEYWGDESSRPLSKTQTQAYYSLPEDERSNFLKIAQDSSKDVRKIKIKGEKAIDKAKADDDSYFDTSTAANKKATKAVISDKVEAGMMLTPQEADLYYLDDFNSAPDKTAYERNQKEEMGYKAALKVYNDEFLSEEMKAEIYKKTETSPEEIEYYKVASEEDGDQYLFIEEQIGSMDSDKMAEFLLMGRVITNDKQLVNDTMVKKLVKSGKISSSLGDALKSVDYVKDNTYTGEDAIQMGQNTYKPVKNAESGTGSGSSSGFGTGNIKKGSLAVKMPKKSKPAGATSIKITAGNGAPYTIKVTKPNLQKKKNWRTIRLKY